MYHLKHYMANESDHVLGASQAAVELIEYGDFQCRYCADVYPAIKLLIKKMGRNLKFVFRHYPMYRLHPMALEAAVASEAAAMQNQFWKMHDMIFENQKYLLRTSLSRFARSLDIEMNAFEDSYHHKKLSQKVIDALERGAKLGVDGTPTFFINGRKYNGFGDFEGLYTVCEQAMICHSNDAVADQLSHSFF